MSAMVTFFALGGRNHERHADTRYPTLLLSFVICVRLRNLRILQEKEETSADDIDFRRETSLRERHIR